MTVRETLRGLHLVTVVSLLVASAGAMSIGVPYAGAEVGKPTSVDVLFERKHLSNVPVGTDLVYRFERTVSAVDLLGQPFADDIKIEVKKVATNGSRQVVIKVFSGDRARDPQVIDDLTSNPVLVVFLDRAIASYMSIAGGKVPYLKDKFRTAMRERSTVEPVKVKFDGKTLDAHRVTLSPYSGDLNAAKMRGYENARFSMVVCDGVPGQFVELLATYENNAKDAPRLEERTLMAGAEIVK
jgi:hypothetical protein